MKNPVAEITKDIMNKYRGFTDVQKAAIVSTVAVASTALVYQAIQSSDTALVSPVEIAAEVSGEDYANDSKGASDAERDPAVSSDVSEQCIAENLPSFINMSLHWDSRSLIVEEGLQSISPPIILVMAAGNVHPAPVPEPTVHLSKNANAIVVGSLSPIGEQSDFSAEHEEVHIVAPSDYYITSANDEGSYQRFSGTSGATPLVTGSLGAFEWLAGYHPTAAEAKLLLKRTAIRTLSSNEKPPKNGVGMVNAYKMGMVGKKLKELCGEDEACFKNKIQDSSTYDFSEDSSVLQLVDRAFPECSGDKCSENFDICTDKAEAIKSLRKEAFLNPDNKELWRALACIYKSSGFTKDAEGAMSFYKALFGSDGSDTSAYNSCNANSDCVLIPSSCSSSDNSLAAVTQAVAAIYYVEGCKGTRLCNSKCRCSNSENVPSGTPGSFKLYTTRCVNSRCVVTKDSWSQPNQPFKSNSGQTQGTEGAHTQDNASSGSR